MIENTANLIVAGQRLQNSNATKGKQLTKGEYMNKIKTTAIEGFNTGKNIVENAEQFVLAISLVIVAIYNGYDLTIREVGDVEYIVRLIASIVISLKGSWELLAFFNKTKG